MMKPCALCGKSVDLFNKEKLCEPCWESSRKRPNIMKGKSYKGEKKGNTKTLSMTFPSKLTTCISIKIRRELINRNKEIERLNNLISEYASENIMLTEELKALKINMKRNKK